MKRLQTGGKSKRTRETENPYLAFSKPSRKKKNAENPLESFSKRNWRQSKALQFHEEEEEDLTGHDSQLFVGMPTSTSASANASASVASAITQARPRRLHNTPGMEWWDVVYLPKELREEKWANPDQAPYDKLRTSNQTSTLYVEHPVPVPPTRQSTDSNEPLKLYQTKAEFKKLRRQNRAQMIQEKRDKIAIGILPPPPPRVKISNLLQVLSTEHSANPSEVEARVRAEMEHRERQHMARNLAEKLTPKERADKYRRRVERDALSSIVHVALFRVTNFNAMNVELSVKRIAKICLTARKFMLSGRLLIVAAPLSMPTMVLVEGGPKSVRRFTRFMMRKIDWSAKTLLEAVIGKATLDDDNEQSADGSSDESSSDESSSPENDDEILAQEEQKPTGVSAKCALVWIGNTSRRDFEGFRHEPIESALDAREMMQSKSIAHLWDMVVDPTEPAVDNSILTGLI